MVVPAPSVPDDLIAVARVIGAYGIKGWVKLAPYSSDASALLHARVWWLQGRAQSVQLVQRMQIRQQGAVWVACWEGCATRTDAERYQGAEICVARQDFPALPNDEYYWTDLVGCAVVHANWTGEVVRVLDNGAHAILEVRHGEQTELIPFVAAHVGRVDVTARRIEVDWQTPA